jgi:Ser/Thr protein kinase RdoA (MazF antagonist)
VPAAESHPATAWLRDVTTELLPHIEDDRKTRHDGTPLTLPRAVLHGDIFMENFMYNPEAKEGHDRLVGIIDFEEVRPLAIMQPFTNNALNSITQSIDP